MNDKTDTHTIGIINPKLEVSPKGPPFVNHPIIDAHVENMKVERCGD